MYNIATIYRFYTPFLNIENEKNNLMSVLKKIEKSLEFDGIIFKKIKGQKWDYYEISFVFDNNLWKIDFFYLSKFNKAYYKPIFKLDIFLNDFFLKDNESKIKTIKFVNNIFECFDWLNEKEFLIDIDNSLSVKKWFFWWYINASYDFSNIYEIEEKFEKENGLGIIEDFINNFKDKTFILTAENSSYYHSLHSIFLYFIYLVYIMYKNKIKTENALDELEDIETTESIYISQIELMKKRLSYVESVHNTSFENYKTKLELFFKMF